jgi:uncharacterized membrane protein
MKMTAMQSVKDQNMLILDLAAGALGSSMYYSMLYGVDNFQIAQIQPIDYGLILISRLIADIIYHNFVSKNNKFGGSIEELVASVVILFGILFQQKTVNIPTKIGTYLIALFAIDRASMGMK